MTPCNNCHGGEGTRPRRNELEWMTRLPGLPTEAAQETQDFGHATPPDVACPAATHGPAGLAQERIPLSGYPWWVRENYRRTLQNLHPSRAGAEVDIEAAALNLRLGLRHFTYNSSRRRDTFHSWSTYTTDINTSSDARLEFRLEVAGNQLPLERGLLALHGTSVDGPYFFNLAADSRQAIFDRSGNLCILPQSLLSHRDRGFLADQNTHLSVGLIPFPDLVNLGGGAWASANLCLPLPQEFRSPQMSEAPAPPSYELNDLLERIGEYRAHRPPRPSGSDSLMDRLFLSSGRRLQNFFELLREDSSVNLDLNDLQDLFLPGLLDLGPSRLGLHARLNSNREVELDLHSLALLFQAMGYARDPDTEEPRLVLESARLTGPAEESALQLRLDPVRRELRAFRAQFGFEAVLSLLRPALRGLEVGGNIQVGLTTERHWTFALNDLSLQLPSLHLNPNPSNPSGAATDLAISLSGGEAPRSLLGVTIPPGLRGTFNPAAGELHLEGNVVLRAELQGARGNFEIRAPLAFFTTLRLDDRGLAPLPGSTALSIEGLEIIETTTRREILRDGELFISDDPNQEVFRERRVLESFSLPDEILARHRSLPATVEFRGIWGNHHQIDLRGRIPLPLRQGLESAYDFSALFEDATEFHLDLLDLNPQALSGSPPAPHFNLIGGVLRAQRFTEADGRQLWDFRLAGETATLGRNRGLISLNEPRMEGELDRLELQAGNLLIRIPLLDFSANPQGSEVGLLRGPVHAHLNGTRRGGLELELDPQRRPVEIRNLDLGFSLQGLDVLPRALRRSLQAGARFIGMDGHLEGHFRMNYPEDPRRWNGHGDLHLRGDRNGDIYLQNEHLRRVGPPLVRDTRWRWERIDGFNWRRGYALGDFHLELLLNPMPLFGPLPSAVNGLRAFGGDGRSLLPGEIWAEMPYDNQPWNPQGFRNRIVDYIQALRRRSAPNR